MKIKPVRDFDVVTLTLPSDVESINNQQPTSHKLNKSRNLMICCSSSCGREVSEKTTTDDVIDGR